MQPEPRRHFNFVQDKFHDAVIPPAIAIIQRYAGGGDDGLAQQRGDLDDLATGGKIRPYPGCNVDGPHRDISGNADPMLYVLWHPHGPAGWHDPASLRADDRQYPGQRVDQLRAGMAVRGNVFAVRMSGGQCGNGALGCVARPDSAFSVHI
ncbi:hypothetical protein D3C75_1070660 [compost metagenome]